MKFLQKLKAKIILAYLSHYNKEISKLIKSGTIIGSKIPTSVKAIQPETDYTSIQPCDLWKEFKKASPCLSCKILSEFKKDGGHMSMLRQSPGEILTRTIDLNYCPTCGEKLE